MIDRIPILKIGQIILVSIQVELHDDLAERLQDDLTQAISRYEAKGVLIDVSAVTIVDSFIARKLADIAAMSRILDAETVLVGIQPAVAITLVELGVSLSGVRTALNVEQGLERLGLHHAGTNGLGGRLFPNPPEARPASLPRRGSTEHPGAPVNPWQ